MAAPSPVPPTPRGEPTLDCDLVMKGGITSGVVYPKAVVRIARDYRIHNIGGTSVGAIAAALTASAEYWRRKNPGPARAQQAQVEAIVIALDTTTTAPDGTRQSGWDDWTREDVRAAETDLLGSPTASHGFAGLYAIPQEVGFDLLGKFHPTPQTQGAFQFLVAIMAATTTATRIVTALTRQFYLIRMIAAVLTCLLALALVRDPRLGMVPLGVLVAAAFGSALRDRIQSPQDGPKAVPWLSGMRRTIAIAVLSLIAWALFIQLGIGWKPIFRWIGDNWLLLVVIALAIGAAANADGVRRWLTRRLAGGDAARQAQLLKLAEIASTVVSIAVLLALLWWQWDAITEDPSGFGTLAIGAVLGWIGGGVVGLLLNALVFIPRNDNGICTGLQAPDHWLVRRFPILGRLRDRLSGSGVRAIALTNWLTAKIDLVAESPAGHHLTFDDLEKATYRHPDGRETGIIFEAVTSELHRGVPLNLPRALGNYGFRPAEFLRFFPQSVVEAILASAIVDYPDEPISADATESAIVRFPRRGAGIPVVVGARMSMSFPVLFSTVPVYHLGQEADVSRQGEKPVPAPLSDGGIVSNFPIHKFDRALSPWPTFAIDLISGTGEAKDAAPDDQFELNPIRVSRLTATQPHIQQANARMVMATSGPAPVRGLVSLFSHILNTARGWMDNSQKTLPGYAERIVGVRQYEGEGGLNLAMTHATIERLANRGMRAVDRLVTTWDPARGTTSQWHQHRWLRYRILLRSLENLGQEWTTRYTVPEPGGHLSIKELVDSTAGGADNQPAAYAYRWEKGDFGAKAATLTGLFDAFATATPAPAAGDPRSPSGRSLGIFDGEFAPIPEPDLLMIPPFE